MNLCILGHKWDDDEVEYCPTCSHLEQEQPEQDIDVGDDDHSDVVPINVQTTEQKGSDIL